MCIETEIFYFVSFAPKFETLGTSRRDSTLNDTFSPQNSHSIHRMTSTICEAQKGSYLVRNGPKKLADFIIT
jgi:hypothetical protein